MFVSNATLRDLISDEVRDVFTGVLTPLWTEAWHLGYAAARSLVTGQPADFTAKDDSPHLQGFIGTEGEHWLSQISRTGLGNNSARSELIARTEVARAINSAAIQCYRDHGVQYKHLLLSPGACDICKDAAEDGDIPLDAPFSSGGILGLSHPGDRCCPAPSWADVEPPLADLGKASGYTLNSRSGMISLDVPEGTITPVPGGVTDHHITVVYLGPDVDDDAFATSCQRVAIAAAQMPGPLAGAISGLGTFPPSDSSDGKVPAWAGVMLPGAELLREALEDLSASEHKDWKPHVTLAYVEPGEALPGPLPATPVTFTHLSVHRGHDEAVRFPLGPVAKGAATEDKSRVAWLLIRARDEDGKWRYLLQQRDDGQWGMPGGTCHVGEDGWAAAVRETTEEVGTLPQLFIRADLSHMDPDGVHVNLFLCEAAETFTPLMNGSTPEETAGTGWFRRKEISDLRLVPKFKDDWGHVIADCLDGIKKDLAKVLQRAVNENGEVLTLTPASQRLQAVGSRWPYPHRADGTETPEGAPGDVPGGTAGEMGAAEPPQWDDMSDTLNPRLYPRGDQDDEYPRRRTRNRPASRFPDQGTEDDEAWPEPQTALTPGASAVGAPKSGGNDSGHPVVGAYQPSALKPAQPHSVPPEAFDPAEAVEDWNPEAGSDVVHDVGKGAADPGDPNPVEAFHVYSQLLGNFSPKALAWVQSPGVHWIGPVAIPHDRIDYDDEASWAAAHEPARVRHFAGLYRRGEDVSPGVSVQKPGKNTINVEDGHHRCLGSRRAGKPFLTYLGFVPQDAGPWDELHSSQLHSGGDPQNK
jgi:8-oxo-dGTP pyrophosphatase MutT (NUDIX family)/2'-5' RNA ligase